MALLNYLSGMAVDDRARSRRARIDIQTAAALLTRFPYAGRASLRWVGSRERSVVPWRKLLVYELRGREVVITLFLDARQDLDSIQTEPE